MNQPDRQRTWTVAEAQSQLSEILRLAAEEGPQHIGADRPFVVVPAETWYAHEQPQRLPQQQSLRTREGTHKGRPLRARTIWQRALVCAHERAPTRGGPYGLERYGNERWFVHTRGRPQGGKAPTRGAPTARTIWQRALVCAHERAPSRGEGTHKGCYGPNDMATSDRLCTREGGHKGRPYGPNDMATSAGEAGGD